MGQYREKYLAAFLLLLGTIVIYLPAVNGDFVFDDLVFVSRNPRLRDFSGLLQIWLDPKANQTYYPLTFTTFWIEYQIWQLWSTGYHLVSILLHGINAILLWVLLRRLAIPGAWVAAAIFAFHPVQVESVAWISERKNLLSGSFYLLTFLCYLRFTPLHLAPGQSESRDWRYYGLALLCFLCALLSKTVTCSLPAALMLLIWWKKGRIRSQEVLPLLPMFAMGIVASSLSAFLEWHPEVVGASGNEWQLTIVERILIAGRALWFYLFTLLWPINLAVVYQRWSIDTWVWWQYLFPISVAFVLTLFLVYRRHIGRGPLVAGLFFAGTLFPTLGFLDFFLMRYTFVADHFLYLPCISIIAGVVGWLWTQQDKILLQLPSSSLITGSFRRNSSEFLLPSAILGVLMLLTWKHAAIYADGMTLWTHAVEKNPTSWLVYNNLGLEFSRQSDSRTARLYLEKAVELAPQEAMVHSNLSNILLETGTIDRSLQHALTAVALARDSAAFASNLSLIYWQKGDLVQAVRYARVALQKKPTTFQVYYNIGILALQGVPTPEAFSFSEAVSYIETAVQLDPNSIMAVHLLAWIRATAPDSTLRDGRKALVLAEEICRRILCRDPNSLDTLAAAYAENGQFDVAVDAARTAADLARTNGKLTLESRIRERLALYQAQTPYYNATQEKFPL